MSDAAARGARGPWVFVALCAVAALAIHHERAASGSASVIAATGVAATNVAAPASTPAGGVSPTATPAPATSPPAARPRAGRPGDLVISGLDGTVPSASLLARARKGQIAGVILMGSNIVSLGQVRALTGALQAAARKGNQLPLLITVDQEGGSVRRFPSAAPTHSARDLGALSLATVKRQGVQTGEDLLARGVNVDFAPVADVPTNAANFLDDRTFATTDGGVARNACTFAAGLDQAGVKATLKHFPGLGGAGATNTDLGPVSIPLSLAALRQGWSTYRTCASATGALVMLSNASYPALTGSLPAILSAPAYAAVRHLGATGPTITDALEAKALAGLSEVAPRAVEAGADLLLYTGEGDARRGYADLAKAIADHHVSASTITARAAVVRAARQALAP